MAEQTSVHASLRKSILGLLQDLTVNDVQTPSTIIQVETSMALEDAFQRLTDNRILSAPAWDEESKKYIGFLDIRDLVKFAVFDVEHSTAISPNLIEVLRNGRLGFKQVVGTITVKYLATPRPFRPVPEGTKIADILSTLATNKRVAVVNEAGKVVNIVSQSSIIRLLAQRDTMATLPEFKVPISHVSGLITFPVATVAGESTAIDMFKVMNTRNLSGLGVVDADGKLIAASSATDLKRWLFSKRSVNKETSMDFLAFIRRDYAPANVGAAVITVTDQDTLAKVIGRLGATKVHRIFVVDTEGRPTGVISLTDILRVLATDPADVAPKAAGKGVAF